MIIRKHIIAVILSFITATLLLTMGTFIPKAYAHSITEQEECPHEHINADNITFEILPQGDATNAYFSDTMDDMEIGDTCIMHGTLYCEDCGLSRYFE